MRQEGIRNVLFASTALDLHIHMAILQYQPEDFQGTLLIQFCEM